MARMRDADDDGSNGGAPVRRGESGEPGEPGEPGGSVRLDKWLWAARFFKTRAMAADAVDGGKVELRGARAKAARAVHLGDQVRIRLGPFLHVVVVRGLSDRRGPASEAQRLYDETAQSRQERERHAWQLRHAAPQMDPGDGRPTKRDRRHLERTRGR